jgi:predicted transcriptional regulator
VVRWFKIPFGRRQLGPLETELMTVLWKRGRGTVRDLLDEGCTSVAYTTAMTTLDRLYKKGLLHRRKQGRAFVYEPAITRAQFSERLACSAIEFMLRCVEPHAVLSYFVDAVGDSDEQLLDELQRAVEKRRERRR